MLVCRRAAAMIIADGCIGVDESRAYGRALGRWQISQSMVTRAILHDTAR